MPITICVARHHYMTGLSPHKEDNDDCIYSLSHCVMLSVKTILTRFCLADSGEHKAISEGGRLHRAPVARTDRLGHKASRFSDDFLELPFCVSSMHNSPPPQKKTTSTIHIDIPATFRGQLRATYLNAYIPASRILINLSPHSRCLTDTGHSLRRCM